MSCSEERFKITQKSSIPAHQNQEIHIKFDESVHYLAFGIRFRFQNLMHRAAGQGISTTKFSVDRGLCTPQRESRAGKNVVDVPHICGPLGTAHSRFSVKSEKLSAICETADCRFLRTFAVEKVQLQ